MSNESFILQLRTLIAAMDQIRNSVASEIQKLEQTVGQLEDESKLGAVSTFDFGLGAQRAAVERVKKSVSKAMREIKKLSKDLEESQTKKMAEQNTSMSDLPQE